MNVTLTMTSRPGGDICFESKVEIGPCVLRVERRPDNMGCAIVKLSTANSSGVVEIFLDDGDRKRLIASLSKGNEK